MSVNFNKQYSKDAEKFFSSLIKGKDVVLVGPARTLVGAKMGTEIDGYNTIVRTNNFFGVSDALSATSGNADFRVSDALYATSVRLLRRYATSAYNVF